MVLKGLPGSFKPFAIHVTHDKDDMTFAEFKTKLRSFEDTEKSSASECSDNVMKTGVRTGREHTRSSAQCRYESDVDIVCFKCADGGRGAVIAKATHTVIPHVDIKTNKMARGRSQMRAATDPKQKRRIIPSGLRAQTSKSSSQHTALRRKACWSTLGLPHIINDIAKFKSFNDAFRPESHSVEPADGTQCRGIAQQRGDAEVFLIDNTGQRRKATLKDALFIPSYPQNIFSVKSATALGATVTFKQGQDMLTHKDGTNFNIHVYGKLYYLQTEVEGNDKCNTCHDIQAWHEILGHCNYEDVVRLQGVVNGMQIKGRTDRPDQECEVCIQGKFAQTRNRDPDTRAKAPLQMVHTDLAGPIATESIGGYKYVQSFTDDYSNSVFVYFLKTKTDTVQAR